MNAVFHSPVSTSVNGNNNDDIRKPRIAIIDIDVHHGNGTEAIVRNLQPHSEALPLPSSWSPVYRESYKPWLDEDDAKGMSFHLSSSVYCVVLSNSSRFHYSYVFANPNPHSNPNPNSNPHTDTFFASIQLFSNEDFYPGMSPKASLDPKLSSFRLFKASTHFSSSDCVLLFSSN